MRKSKFYTHRMLLPRGFRAFRQQMGDNDLEAALNVIC
jgi:hypothetical protein